MSQASGHIVDYDFWTAVVELGPILRIKETISSAQLKYE